MAEDAFPISGIIEGRNSLRFQTPQESVLYEKLANTIHSGTREEIEDLQKRVESVEYHPVFETESLKKRKEKPLGVLLLEITEQCDLRCDYCINSGDYSHERTYGGKKMDFDVAKRALEDLVPLSRGSSLIGFYGGEPLLNMELIKRIINYSKERFPEKELMFSMTTNFFAGQNHIREIVDNGMYINLSLDGPRIVHDRFRKTKEGRPTYDKIISNLKGVEEYSPGYVQSHFFILSTCYDPNDLAKVIEYFDEEELFVSHINSVEKKGRNQGESFPEADNRNLDSEYVRRILNGEETKTLRRLFDQDLKAVAFRGEEAIPSELMLHGSCYPGRRRVFVDISGGYHPCERFGSRMRIGSISEGLQSDLSDQMVDNFAKIREGLCGECWAQRLCKPCLQYAKDPEGEISERGLSLICGNRKKQLATAISNYVTLIRSDKEEAEKYFKTINPLFERG